jgi:anti-anti-sigma factor
MPIGESSALFPRGGSMALKLSVITRDASGIILAAAYGEATARDFAKPETMLFDQILGATWATQRVALDMDAVPYLDSSAIGWLIQAQKQFREAGGFLVLHSVQPHVKNILSLLKIERVVPMGRDIAGAKTLLTTQEPIEWAAGA